MLQPGHQALGLECRIIGAIQIDEVYLLRRQRGIRIGSVRHRRVDVKRQTATGWHLETALRVARRRRGVGSIPARAGTNVQQLVGSKQIGRCRLAHDQHIVLRWVARRTEGRRQREGDSRRSRIRRRSRNHSGSVTGASSRIDGYKTRTSPEVRRKPGRIGDAVVPRCRRVASPAAAGIRRSRIRARKIPTVHIVQRLQKLLGTIVGQPAQVDPRTIDPARLNRVRDCHRGRRRLRQKNSSIAHQHQKAKCQRES